MKDIVNIKWAKMEDKVANLAEEVFEEVVEHEMALAGLETFKFEDAIPADVKVRENRSLLKRMTTL